MNNKVQNTSRSIVWLFAVSFLGACATPTVIDPHSHFYPPPVGTVLILEHDIDVPADWARVTIQRGAVAPSVHPFATWCQLEVHDVMPAPQTIRADTFTVRKVSRDMKTVVSVGVPQMVAQSGMSDSSGTNDVTQVWHLWLSSPAQANVRRLTCGGAFDRPWKAEYPSIEDIRATLGKVMTLRLPG